MNILFLNGSPRMNGNTSYAIQTIANQLKNSTQNNIEILDICKLSVSGCINCDGCKRNGGNCVIQDDSKQVMDKIEAADAVVFGSPVYWWGISSQLKAVIDKFYSKDELFHQQKKKIGVITIGANDLDNPQYRLIRESFECIVEYLGWELAFDLSFVAWHNDDLKASSDANSKLIEASKVFSDS